MPVANASIACCSYGFGCARPLATPQGSCDVRPANRLEGVEDGLPNGLSREMRGARASDEQGLEVECGVGDNRPGDGRSLDEQRRRVPIEIEDRGIEVAPAQLSVDVEPAGDGAGEDDPLLLMSVVVGVGRRKDDPCVAGEAWPVEDVRCDGGDLVRASLGLLREVLARRSASSGVKVPVPRTATAV
jgi:hypothetical protein